MSTDRKPTDSLSGFEIGTIAVVLCSLLVILLLAIIPVPVEFSGSVTTSVCDLCGYPYFADVFKTVGNGSQIRFSWQVAPGSPAVSFIAWENAYGRSFDFCGQTGTSGNCTITSRGGIFDFSFDDSMELDGPIEIQYWGIVIEPLL